MIETIPFKTQARTIDHLGREQIADCPTAISELWKNAYDAYARSASLHIFDDHPEPVAAIFDDGHGMSYEEFVNRWLVIGTQAKFNTSINDEDDRNGLSFRSKQGQKGIGRLSSANLGSLLLVVSKRKDHSFVTALIDWRIFENPFLVLSDIEVPVAQFNDQSELLDLIPELFERLTNNVWGNASDEDKTERLTVAWEAYDVLKLEEDPTVEKPSVAIAETIINSRFDIHHLEQWPVWTGESGQGTSLLISNINYDLRAQLSSVVTDGGIERIRKNFFATLSAFTDPYVDEAASEVNALDPEFTYEVKTWSGGVGKPIIEDDREAINRSITNAMEHVLSGNIDRDGVFRGQVKAFGEWRREGVEYEIYPPKDFSLPKRADSVVGPVGLNVATFEVERLNSTHSDDEHADLVSLSEQHSGFMIFRNGLRVLPYGRIENDFFEIETRRSKQAGREFWNARRMFGRISLSRELNPNLRDKAGREGLIDNRSAKALRTLVANILQRVAYEYFGLASDLRKELLPKIREQNFEARAEVERKNLAKKNGAKFRSRLKKNLPATLVLFEKTRSALTDYQISNEADLVKSQVLINELNVGLSELRLTGAPAKLGSMEDDYRAFRTAFVQTQELVKKLIELRTEAIERINPAKPDEIADRQLQSYASRLQARLRTWRKSISAIQQSEQYRVDELFKSRNRVFHGIAIPVVDQVKIGRLDLDSALKKLDEYYEVLDDENEDIFQSYLDTLELVSENINIELIARQGTTDNILLRDELNSLNRLAQLGVTVEIIGHELNANERMIREGLKQVKAASESPGLQLIETGFGALSHQLEFLSPLKVSGTRVRKIITGQYILEYLRSFFDVALESREITIEATEEFTHFQVTELPSRVLPVFVNLVNNSIYWLVNSHAENPKIELSASENSVVVGDNGPGIDSLDQESLFKMFFTRKVGGGHGLGLYLCRVNLKAGGHTIQYLSLIHI